MGTALNILGGLAVFLYGMKVMSNGLQKLAGDRLRAMLAALTTNRYTGIVGGFGITALIQSSSATTVLIVSFANAGLLTMVQATGLVMGANIGTTVTGWLVSIFGFKVKITAFALPMIGIGFPLSFMSEQKWRHLSEVLVGFGLLFLGLGFLKAGVPNIDPSNAADLAKIEFILRLTDYGFGSTLLFVLIGTLLTVVIQSSSATMAITLVLADQGWIGFDLAAAMVLGENIGTTVTANLAAIGASRNAVRVARFHTLFNIIGVVWMLIAMPFVLDVIPGITGGDPVNNPGDRATALALFHTFFNITNTFVLMWFANKLVAAVMWMVPRQDAEREGPHLQFLETHLLETPELATVEARRGLFTLAAACQRMFGRVRDSLVTPEKVKFGAALDAQKDDEKATDEMEEEIVHFASQLARTGTSNEVAREVTLLLDSVDELESIGDRCLSIVKMSAQKRRRNASYGDEARAELEEMVDVVGEMVDLTVVSLDPVSPEIHTERVKELMVKARGLYAESRSLHAARMGEAAAEDSREAKAGSPTIRASLLFLEIMSDLREIADYAWNAASAVSRYAGK